MVQRSGVFIISLDFEIYWGVRDHSRIEAYEQNLRGVHTVIPLLLELFQKYGIRATWATVGLLGFRTRGELLAALPKLKPIYDQMHLSPYPSIHKIGETPEEDPFHYAPDIIQQIIDTPGQEFATHTFSHYYCLESGQTTEAFREDLRAAVVMAQAYHQNLISIVFPRNQVHPRYLAICKEQGLRIYRGTETSWFYQPKPTKEQHRIHRMFRLLDSYIPIGGMHTYPKPYEETGLLNAPSSRFLRPYMPQLARLETQRLRRITTAMTYAARRGEIFHLWWHPHNFGAYTEENMQALEYILKHFEYVQTTYGMESYSMRDLVWAEERT